MRTSSAPFRLPKPYSFEYAKAGTKVDNNGNELLDIGQYHAEFRDLASSLESSVLQFEGDILDVSVREDRREGTRTP